MVTDMKEKTIYALGFFDGVHLGHAALLKECGALAKKAGCACGVVTFEGHPDTLLLSRTPALINTSPDRDRLLAKMGAVCIVKLPFDEKLMRLPWQDFFRLLLDTYHAAGVVVGSDFRFGFRGEGNAEKLSAACQAAGISCIIVPQQTVDGIRVSSTHIRTLLENGEMETAVKFLGHPHILSGKVVPGRHIGRTIGVPTANLLLPEGLLIPKFGVYACMAHVNGRIYEAVTNIGSRPTVEGHQVRAESWILDFDGNLYGNEITLEFYSFLRPERKFASLEELQEEIQKNALQTRKFFEKN